jgi:hypothetical protein
LDRLITRPTATRYHGGEGWSNRQVAPRVLRLLALLRYPARAVNTNNIPEKRARLATVEERLAGLRVQYDLLMSAFKFDEARELFTRIEAAERERVALAKDLPAPAPAPPPVPVQLIRRKLPPRVRRRLR